MTEAVGAAARRVTELRNGDVSPAEGKSIQDEATEALLSVVEIIDAMRSFGADVQRKDVCAPSCLVLRR